MEIVKLKKRYKKIISDYIETFKNDHEVEVSSIGDLGGVIEFSDVFCDFSDLKYSVDNNLDLDFIVNWYYFTSEYGKACPINFQSYAKLREDFMFKAGFNFNELAFDNSLLKMRLKNLTTK